MGAWMPDSEDKLAYEIYQEVVRPKILKEIPSWAQYENMAITGWMLDDEGLDFKKTLFWEPYERVKELWRYMETDLQVSPSELDYYWSSIVEGGELETTLKTLIRSAESSNGQDHSLWELSVGNSEKELGKNLSTLHPYELKNAYKFTPPNPPPIAPPTFKDKIDYMLEETQSFGGRSEKLNYANGRSGDRGSWLSMSGNRIRKGWGHDHIRSYSSMSFSRVFEWQTGKVKTIAEIAQEFNYRATLHFRPKNTSNHTTKIITVKDDDKEVQVRRYFTHLHNHDVSQWQDRTITLFIRSLSYAANQKMPNGNKDEPFTIERGVIENYLSQDAKIWIYDTWEECFSKDWEEAAKEAYENITPMLLGLSVRPTFSYPQDKKNTSGLEISLVVNKNSWFDMKKHGWVEVEKYYAEGEFNEQAIRFDIPVEFSFFHGYTTYAEQKHPRMKFYERGFGLFNWWW